MEVSCFALEASIAGGKLDLALFPPEMSRVNKVPGREFEFLQANDNGTTNPVYTHKINITRYNALHDMF